jgi:hypothetical protein
MFGLALRSKKLAAALVTLAFLQAGCGAQFYQFVKIKPSKKSGIDAANLPKIEALENLTTNEDTPTAPITFVLTKAEDFALTCDTNAFTYTSSNTALVPSSGAIALSGTWPSCSAVITPAANAHGSATIGVAVTHLSAAGDAQSFTLTVNPVNDAPTMAAILSPQTTAANTSKTIALTVDDVDGPLVCSSANFLYTSSNTALVPAAGGVSWSGTWPNCTGTIDPVTNANGSADITFKISDGSLMAERTFTVAVTLPTAPSALTYPEPGYAFLKDVAIATQTPTKAGDAVTSCTASPSLPPGLTIHPTTCAISGTPTAAQAGTIHTITAANSAGSTTTTIVMGVANSASASAPSSLVYAGTPFVLTQYEALATQTPTKSGDPALYCVAVPALPSGLALDPTTCAISGTPTVTTAAATHTIKVANDRGSTTATVSILLRHPYPAFGISAESGLDSQVLLAWQIPNTPASLAVALSAYKIYRSTVSGFTPGLGNLVTTVIAPTTTYTDSGVANGTRYYYKVVAVYSTIEAPPSVEAPALPLAPGAAADASNVFVAPTGNDTTGTGSLGNPFLTVSRGLTAVTAGGTIFLKDGYYTTFPTLNKSVTIQSMTGNYRTSAAVISQSGSQTVGTVINLRPDANDITLRGLEGVNFLIGVYSIERSGLGLYNNHFHNTTDHWFFTYSSQTNWVVHGNLFQDIGTRSTNVLSVFNFWGGSAHTNWTIAHNVFENPAWAAIQLTISTQGTRIVHNTFLDNCSTAVQLYEQTAAGDTLIAYNVIKHTYKAGGNAGCRGGGILIRSVALWPANYRATIHHNTFTQNDVGMYFGVSGSDSCDATSKQISIFGNNIETDNTIGLQLDCAGNPNLSNNYWGHSSGPAYSGNPGGTGATINVVTGTAIIAPFATSSFPTPVSGN